MPEECISVVIPAYNEADTLGDQLDALAEQGFAGRWEVVVADNGSTDGTVELVRRRVPDYPVLLRLVDASGLRGASFARNVGVLATTGEWLAFCDGDDVVAPGWLEAVRRGLAEHTVLAGAVRVIDSRGQPGELLNPMAMSGHRISSGNFAVRRETYLRIGGFDEGFPPYGNEDSDFSLRLLRAGIPITPAPTMGLFYRSTLDRWTLVRKTWLVGVTDAVLWSRHPTIHEGYLDRRRLRRALLEHLVALPRWRPSQGSYLRELVVRAGRLHGEKMVRAGRIDPPRLIEPPEDSSDQRS